MLRRVVLLMVVAAILYPLITFFRVWHAAGQDDTREADAAIVLGAAQYDGQPSQVFRSRLDHAKELFDDETVPFIVVTGGRQEGDRFTEAFSGYKYLLEEGVPEDAIVVIDDGQSTWESLAASVRILNERGIGSVLLVSDSYHSLRSKAIASEVGLDASASPSSMNASFEALVREAALVSVGDIIGYRRMLNIAPS